MLNFSKGDCAGDYAIEEQVQRCGGVGGTKVQSAECRCSIVQCAECRVQNAECRVQSAECRRQSAGFVRVQNAKCRGEPRGDRASLPP